MKKLLLPLLLVFSFIFAGFENASAQTITASSTAGMAPVSPALLPSATASNLVLLGTTFTNTTSSAISINEIDFKASVKPNTNFPAANAQLWVNTTGTTFAGATQITGPTYYGGSTTDDYFYNFTSTVPAGSAYTYFIVESYTTAVTTNTTDTYTSLYFFDTNFNEYIPGTTISRTYILPTAATASVTGVATSTSTVAGSGGTSSSATISAAGTYTIQGTQIVGSAAVATSKAITALSFTTSNALGNSYFYGTAYLFAGTAAGPTGSAIATITTNGTTTLNFTGLTGQYLAYGTTLYYYVEILYSTVTASAATTLSFASATGPTVTNGAVAGPAYTYSPTPYVLTLSSLTATAGSNGLSATPVVYGSTNYSVYGFSLLGTGGTGTTAINSLTFNRSGTSSDVNSLYYTTAYLYSSTTPTYVPGTTNVAGNLVATTTATASNSIIFTPATPIAASNTTNMYYFIVLSNTLGDANTNTFQLTYASSTVTGTAITPGTTAPAVTGPAYTFKPVPPTTVTFTSYGSTSTTGLSSSPVLALQNNLAIYGFTLTGSGTGTTQTVTSLTFATSVATNAFNNAFFTSIALYSSTSSTFNIATATAVPGATATLGANYASFTLTPTTALSVPASTTPAVYYYLVVNYTKPSTSTTNDTWQLNYSSGVNGSGTALTSGTTTTGYNYVFPPLTITATDVTTGLNPVPNSSIYQGQSGLALAGEGLSTKTTGTTATLSQLTFNFTPTAVATASAYFSNPPILYSSTSATFSLTGATPATPVTGATGALTAGTVTFTLPSAVTLTTTPIYFYMVLNYTVTGGTVPQVFTFTPATYTTSFSTTAGNTGFSSNTYTCAPPVSVALSSTNGFSATTITSAQTGQALYGFGLSSYPANTFTTFNFTSTGTIGNISTYFANLKLYSSTTNDFTTATLVTDPYVVTPSALNSTSFTISGLSQTITNSTVYYFIVLDVTGVPGTGTATFTPSLASIATSSTTYNTTGQGFPLVGQTYTLQAPVTLTYYWYGSGTTTDWRNPKNWITNTTSFTNAGSYPGATTSDVASFNDNYFYDGGPLEYPTIGAYAITISALNINDVNFNAFGSYAELTVNSGGSLTTNTLTLTSPEDDGAEFGITGTLATNTAPSVTVTGATTLGNVSDIYLAGTGGNIYFGPSSTTTINGTATYTSYLVSDGGNMTAAAGSVFNLAGAYSTIQFTAGTMTAAGSTFNLSGNYTNLSVYGGAMQFNAASTINVTGTGTKANTSGVYISSGSIGLDASILNLGLTNANGSKSEVYNIGGTFTLSDVSTLNMNGPTTLLYNASTSNTPATSIFNINNSTINLGTTTVSGSGTTSLITNTEDGVFNLNANSVINLNGTTATVSNASTTTAGSTYYGIFVAASTSVMNPNSTTSVISNNANASNYFTLVSDANASATIGKLAAGAKLTGQFNVQRYLNGGQYYLRNYRLLSSPVNKTAATSNLYNLVDLDYLGASATLPTTPAITYNGAFIAGPGGSFTGIHNIANPLMYLYQENIVPGTAYNAQFTSGKNVGITNLSSSSYTLGTASTAAGAGSPTSTSAPSVSTAIALPAYDNNTANTVSVPPGNAYLLYYIDNNTRTDAASAHDIPGASNVTASGYINQAQVQLYMWGSVSGTLTTTYGLAGVRLPGITMVGNPYPSTIDLKQVYLDNSTTITPTLYQLDNTTQMFNSYNASTNASSTSLSSEYIATGLGFYIHVDSLQYTNNRYFYFQEDQKTPSTTAAFFPPISEYAVIPRSMRNVDNVNLPSNGGSARNALTTNSTISNNNTAVTSEQNFAALEKAMSMNPDAFNVSAVKDTSKRVGKLRPIITSNLAVNTYTPPYIAPEAPQPAHPATTKIIANPAGLHLKFVVDSVTNDEVGIFFNKAWADTYDSNDSYDLDGQSGKVYLSSYTSDGVRTSVNALGDYKQGKQVKLFVKASTAGIFQLQMTDIANFNTKKYSVFLLDKMLNDSLDLTLYKSYNFNYTAGTAGDSTRFVLAIEHKPIPHYALLTFAGAKVTQGVKLDWTTLNEENYTQFVLQKLNSNNTFVFLDSLQSDSGGAYSYTDQHPSLGNNTYRLQQTDGLGNITYSAPVTIGYNSTNPNGGLVLYPNPAKTTMTVTLTTSTAATTVATADIYNSLGKLIEHKVINSNSFVHDVSAYDLGVYIIELKNSNGVLVGKSKFVKVN